MIFSRATAINSILFNLAWFGCIFQGNLFGLAVIAWAAIHLKYAHSVKSESTLLVSITLIGLSIDSALMHFGILSFLNNTNIIPFWLMMIWLAFAMTLNGYLKPLQSATLLQCIVGAIFPPLSYMAGHSLGVVNFNYSPLATLVVLSLFVGLFVATVFSYQSSD